MTYINKIPPKRVTFNPILEVFIVGCPVGLEPTTFRTTI